FREISGAQHPVRRKSTLPPAEIPPASSNPWVRRYRRKQTFQPYVNLRDAAIRTGKPPAFFKGWGNRASKPRSRESRPQSVLGNPARGGCRSLDAFRRSTLFGPPRIGSQISLFFVLLTKRGLARLVENF